MWRPRPGHLATRRPAYRHERQHGRRDPGAEATQREPHQPGHLAQQQQCDREDGKLLHARPGEQQRAAQQDHVQRCADHRAQQQQPQRGRDGPADRPDLTGSDGSRSACTGGVMAAAVSSSTMRTRSRPIVTTTSSSAAASRSALRPSVTGPITEGRGSPSMDVQVNTGRMSSGTAPAHSQTRPPIVTAAAAYAISRLAHRESGLPTASTAPGHLARDERQHDREQPQQPPRDEPSGQRRD